MAVRVLQAAVMALVLGGWVLYQLFIRKKDGRILNDEVMFIAFFMAVWVVLSMLLW